MQVFMKYSSYASLKLLEEDVRSRKWEMQHGEQWGKFSGDKKETYPRPSASQQYGRVMGQPGARRGASKKKVINGFMYLNLWKIVLRGFERM